MAERDTALMMAQQALEQITESVGEITTSTATAAARVEALGDRVEKIETAINGSGRDNPGLETRVALLERAEESRAKSERKRASQPAAPVESEIAKVETARAAAASKRWEAVKSWAPLAAVGGAGAGVAKLVEWALTALGGQ